VLTQTARLNNTNIIYGPEVTSQVLPPFLVNTNSFYSVLVRQGQPIPNWTPDAGASSNAFGGVVPSPAPNWTSQSQAGSNNFTPSGNTVTPTYDFTLT
jgi:hypothetical protein